MKYLRALALLFVAGWALLHGLITLELFGHLQPIIGDAGALYHAEVEALLARLSSAERG